jgi:hypothetical protein
MFKVISTVLFRTTNQNKSLNEILTSFNYFSDVTSARDVIANCLSLS